MALGDELIEWDSTITDLTVTNLASLADSNIWQSGELNENEPCYPFAQISYEIVFNATPIAGDSLVFLYSKGDEAASNEVWWGNIGTSEGQITTAAAKAEVEAACPCIHEHAWRTSHGSTFKGGFMLRNFGPSFQLLIKANGEALSSSGHRLRIRYGWPKIQQS